MEEKKGYIYILTNPSFPDWVKIGYADDVKKRVNDLNNSPAVPFAFRVYATYEVSSRLSDTKVHSIIDRINPSLRSIDQIHGKKRVREFYAMSAEDAYAILQGIAEINGLECNLKLNPENEEERQQRDLAQQVSEEAEERRSPFRFSMIGVHPGEEIAYIDDASIVCKVLDDRHIEYEGQPYSLSALAQKLSESSHRVQGPIYFTYHDEVLDDIRQRMESEKSDFDE